MGKMDEKEKFEANKRSNAPFLRALGVLMKEKNFNQAQVAELLGTKSGTFSDYKNGKKRASQEMFDRLARAFAGRLNMHYLTGESEYMMLSNVPNEEIVEYSMRDSNPDYDVQKKAKAASVSNDTPAAMPSSLERSFVIEKEIGNTKSYMDKYIASLEDQIKKQNEMIADKNKIIEMLEKKVADYESAASFINENDFWEKFREKYPFNPGVAEEMERLKATRV